MLNKLLIIFISYNFKFKVNSIDDKEKILIDKLSLFNQSVFNLLPLGAKILSLLSISCQRSFTFYDIIEITEASKGYVSWNLNLLLERGLIGYETNPGERKKYYFPVPFSERFDRQMSTIISLQKEIIELMLAYDSYSNCNLRIEEYDKIVIYKEYHNELVELYLRTVEKLKKLE